MLELGIASDAEDVHRSFHKQNKWLWKCGKLNFPQIAPFALRGPLQPALTPTRLLLAPSTERE
jgi:hypothetical protein